MNMPFSILPFKHITNETNKLIIEYLCFTIFMLTFAGRKKFDAIVFKDFRKLNRKLNNRGIN